MRELCGGSRGDTWGSHVDSCVCHVEVMGARCRERVGFVGVTGAPFARVAGGNRAARDESAARVRGAG